MAKIIKIAAFIATLVFAGIVLFFIWFGWAWSRDEAKAKQKRDDQRSGKEAFGDQPALFAVAQAIVRNDQEGIRAALKDVPDLQAAGRNGTTLLYFAVSSTWHNERQIETVKTLLAAGADPNFNNGQPLSFALADAAAASTAVLRVMLDAGGDPNGRDSDGVPIIFSNWDVGAYTPTESHSRFELLLERGLDVNSTMPESGRCCHGYSLLLYRITKGMHDKDAQAYADALQLLERGADPHRATPSGKTFAQMLVGHRDYFAAENKTPPQQFQVLWEWAQSHGSFPRLLMRIRRAAASPAARRLTCDDIRRANARSSRRARASTSHPVCRHTMENFVIPQPSLPFSWWQKRCSPTWIAP
jgi:ankyrin repeat protein